MRGYFPALSPSMVTPSLFPAYAGVFPSSVIMGTSRGSLPRLCGGISLNPGPLMPAPDSSPPMRGYFPGRICATKHWVLFPAYAGVFPGRSWSGSLRFSLPRLCGGISIGGKTSKSALNSSPPMRGYFLRRISRLLLWGLFPAYAGVFPLIRHITIQAAALPRLCGGISEKRHKFCGLSSSSPPMRGYFQAL